MKSKIQISYFDWETKNNLGDWTGNLFKIKTKDGVQFNENNLEITRPILIESK